MMENGKKINRTHDKHVRTLVRLLVGVFEPGDEIICDAPTTLAVKG